MKIAAASLSDDALFEAVAAIICEVNGAKRADIVPEAALAADLGIAGDDGHALFERLHERFEMDWTGLDLGLHFGDGGLGPPLPPWRLGAARYEHQPLTVAALIGALKAGRWPDLPKVERPRGARVRLQAASWTMSLVMGGVAVTAVVALLSRALGS